MSNQDPSVFQAALARGLISRRTVMAGMAGVTAAGALAACGSAGTGSSGPSAKAMVKAAKDMSATEKLVNWSNWPSYMDVNTTTKSHPSLDDFTKKTGIKVNYTEDYNDNNEFYAKVRCWLPAPTPAATCGSAPTGWLPG